MTSTPASRSARATILAPRSCPSSPGLATRTRILRSAARAEVALWSAVPDGWEAPSGAFDPGPVIEASPDQRVADLLRDPLDAHAIPRDERPVEPLAVPGPPRDQVEMKVRHRLEGRRAVGLEEVEPVGRQRALERQGNALRGRYRRLEVGHGGLEDGRRVRPRDHETVPVVERVDVHEGEGPLVLEDPRRRNLTVTDLAEDAVHLSSLGGGLLQEVLGVLQSLPGPLDPLLHVEGRALVLGRVGLRRDLESL